jgi:hypothetical protein
MIKIILCIILIPLFILISCSQGEQIMINPALNMLSQKIVVLEKANINLQNSNQLLADNNKELKAEIEVEKEVIKILSCESGFKHDGVWGDDFRSYGIAQFQEKTFNELKKLAEKPNYKWKSQKDQMELLKWAIKNGYAKKWTCATVNKKKLSRIKAKDVK